MKIGILSDLHLSRAPQAPPAADVDAYVLAGDIARPGRAIAWAAELGKPAVYVPGNHEFYGGSLPGVVRELRRLAVGTQVHVLDNEEVCLGGVRFIGSTLWSDFLLDGEGEPRETAMRAARRFMHDFRRIHVDEERQVLFTPEHSARLFARNAKWLRERLARPWPGTTVVVTHHAPSALSVHPRFAGSPLNGCFASNLDDLLDGERVALWIHGHMHHGVDCVVRGTRVICNPRGYVTEGRAENPAFDPQFGVVLD